ncbi:hypothetical protein GCM10010974_36100 [Brevibacterium sediminis]|uniref:Uncharacterized protein n=1 Tax=Brevibacterium sediminis TaxID=1857024 RepID=A0ABQ1N1J9_9MICO|nr:hypothetical protein GCM10010974_36100 [Brevibacterium sediminis]
MTGMIVTVNAEFGASAASARGSAETMSMERNGQRSLPASAPAWRRSVAAVRSHDDVVIGSSSIVGSWAKSPAVIARNARAAQPVANGTVGFARTVEMLSLGMAASIAIVLSGAAVLSEHHLRS